MGQVHTLSAIRVESRVSYGADYADYRVPGFVIFRWSKANAFADGAFSGPIFVRQPFIDNCYLFGILRVSFGEVATHEDGNSHGVKIAGRDHRVLNHRCLTNGQYWIAFNCQAATPIVAR